MNKELAQVWGTYLDSKATWDPYMHITYRPWPRQYVNPRGFLSQVTDMPSPTRARRLFHEFIYGDEQWNIPGLVQKINSRVDYFYAEELGKLGRSHQHSLLKGDGLRDLWRKDLHAWWFKRAGRTLIEPFNPDLGAAYYLAKEYPAKQVGTDAHRGLWYDLVVGNRALISHRPAGEGGVDQFLSVELEQDFFKLGLIRRKR
jgi:hypothetical protein